MKIRSILTAGAVALAFLATSASATSPWSVRARATYLVTADKSDAFSALGLNFASGAVSVSDKLIPEFDVAYNFNDTVSAELVLTIPQQHSVTLAGVGRLGSFRHLPPTLLLQYRANAGSGFRPYVGLGVNYTVIWDDDLSVAGVPLSLEHSSLGVAVQAGFDCKVNDRWSFNADLKYAKLASEVLAGSARLTTARLDPVLYSIGAKYAF
jgi:outer membrane protein